VRWGPRWNGALDGVVVDPRLVRQILDITVTLPPVPANGTQAAAVA
jgi:hypothetical protein